MGGRETVTGELWPDSPLSCCQISQESGEQTGARSQEPGAGSQSGVATKAIQVMEEFDQIQTAEFREAFDEFDKV